jgi:disulfide bond formation protein DsbB
MLQIGRTSSLVLTLCGVLKDVLLVAASVLLWDTPVSSLHFFGYAISLAGLIYYKLGPDQLRASYETTRSSWTAFSAKNPIMKTLILLCTAIILIFALFGILLPTYAPGYDPKTFLLSGAASVGLT